MQHWLVGYLYGAYTDDGSKPWTNEVPEHVCICLHFKWYPHLTDCSRQSSKFVLRQRIFTESTFPLSLPEGDKATSSVLFRCNSSHLLCVQGYLNEPSINILFSNCINVTFWTRHMHALVKSTFLHQVKKTTALRLKLVGLLQRRRVDKPFGR